MARILRKQQLGWERAEVFKIPFTALLNPTQTPLNIPTWGCHCLKTEQAPHHHFQ